MARFDTELLQETSVMKVIRVELDRTIDSGQTTGQTWDVEVGFKPSAVMIHMLDASSYAAGAIAASPYYYDPLTDAISVISSNSSWMRYQSNPFEPSVSDNVPGEILHFVGGTWTAFKDYYLIWAFK